MIAGILYPNAGANDSSLLPCRVCEVSNRRKLKHGTIMVTKMKCRAKTSVQEGEAKHRLARFIYLFAEALRVHGSAATGASQSLEAANRFHQLQ